MNKRAFKILAIIFAVSAVVSLPIFAAFAANVPVRKVDLESDINYAAGDAGAWHVDKEAYWTKKGVANIDLTLNANPVRSDKHYDLVLVVDQSGSMFGDTIDEAKADMKEFANVLLSDGQSRMALISFSDRSFLRSGFTNDVATIERGINGLHADGSTNYYNAYNRVLSLLEDYEPVAGNDLCVMLVSDGYPNDGHPREVAEYKLLKEKYPNSFVYGVQYGMGYAGNMLNVTDKMEKSDHTTFLDKMMSLSGLRLSFDTMILSDYINNQYFELTGKMTGDGRKTVDAANDGTPMVIWDVSKTGFNGTMPRKLTVEIKLKDEYINDEDGLFPTNKQLRGISSIKGINSDSLTFASPVLKLKYWVRYEANAPDGCTVEGTLPTAREEVVFSTVRIADTAITCGDWDFKGWIIRTESAERINKDYFIMGNEDIYIEGTWGRPAITKSTEGTPWQESYALLDTGLNVNTKLNKLANKKITAIKKADVLLEDRITSTNNKISVASSPINIYAWFNSDDSTIYIYSDADTIKGNSNSEYLFAGSANSSRLSAVKDFSGVADWDMSGVTTLRTFLAGNTALEDLDDFANWDVSHVTSLWSAFSALPTGNIDGLANWNTESLTDSRTVFSNSKSLTNIDALAGWKMSKVTNMYGMFSDCTSLTDISGARNWGVRDLTMMSNLFANTRLTSLDGLQDWGVSNVTNMSSTFSNISTLQDISALANWDVSNVKTMDYLFSGDSSLGDISALARKTVTRADGTEYAAWNTAKATNLSGTFKNVGATSTAGLLDWDVSSVSTLYETFSGSGFANLDGLAKWDTSKVTNMESTFSGMYRLASVAGLAKWNTSNVTTMIETFFDQFVTGTLTNLTGLEYKLVEEEGKDPYYAWDTSKVTTMERMFYYQDALQNVDALINWKTPALRNMKYMFHSCTSLSSIYGLSNFNTTRVNNIDEMLSGDSSLADIGPLSGWDVSGLSAMRRVFYNTAISDLTPIRGWNVSNITDMSELFSFTRSLRSLEGLQDWKPCKLTNLTKMFNNATALTDISQLDGWAKNADDSSCIKPKDLTSMFYEARSLTTLHGLENWDMSALTTIQYILYNAVNIEDISAMGEWHPVVLSTMYYAFRADAKLTTEDLAVLENWNATLTTTPSVLHAYDGIPDSVVRPTIAPSN